MWCKEGRVTGTWCNGGRGVARAVQCSSRGAAVQCAGGWGWGCGLCWYSLQGVQPLDA